MKMIELDYALRQLRLAGLTDVLDVRLRHAQAKRLPPIDLVAPLANDELQRCHYRLLGGASWRAFAAPNARSTNSTPPLTIR